MQRDYCLLGARRVVQQPPPRRIDEASLDRNSVRDGIVHLGRGAGHSSSEGGYLATPHMATVRLLSVSGPANNICNTRRIESHLSSSDFDSHVSITEVEAADLVRQFFCTGNPSRAARCVQYPFEVYIQPTP